MINFDDLVQELSGISIFCAGDILLDRYIIGEAHRLSPEAPIPVLHAHRQEDKLGGAANVADNLSHLNIACHLAGFIGNDDIGEKIKTLLTTEAHCTSTLVSIENWPSTLKTRLMAGTKHLLRVDQEQPLKITDLDRLHYFEEAWKHAIGKSQALILSDYGRGLFSKDLLAHFIKQARQHNLPIIVDPKGTNYEKYNGATLITPNKIELSLASGGLPTHTLEDCVIAAQHLLKTIDVEGILVTRSADGMTYITREGVQANLPTQAQSVFDVSGAGDTVVAMIATGMALDWPMEKTMELATLCASIVVGKAGTAVVEPDELARKLDTLKKTPKDTYKQKIMSWDTAKKQLQTWQKRGYKIGFANGCYDLLHEGHLATIDFAKEKCDKLIMGLNSDASVKTLKGPSRPLQNQQTRAKILSALSAIDGVVLFDEETPFDLIQHLLPDVLIKGADYKIEDIVGADIVIKNGGRVELAPILEGHSTTKTVNKINTAEN